MVSAQNLTSLKKKKGCSHRPRAFFDILTSYGDIMILKLGKFEKAKNRKCSHIFKNFEKSIQDIKTRLWDDVGTVLRSTWAYSRTFWVIRNLVENSIFSMLRNILLINLKIQWHSLRKIRIILSMGEIWKSYVKYQLQNRKCCKSCSSFRVVHRCTVHKIKRTIESLTDLKK